MTRTSWCSIRSRTNSSSRPVSENLQLTVVDPKTLEDLPEHENKDRLGVAIEVETGLTRGGLKATDVPAALARTRQDPHVVGPISVWTHLASPENAETTAAQIAEFDRAIAMAADAGAAVGTRRSMGATGGVLSGRSPLYEGVRVGLGLYGLVPDDLPIPDHIQPFARRLRPAMALKCMPLRVETFPKGTAVGYGGTWVAQRESVIATLPVGYGDGFVRAYSPGAQALVRGSRVPLVGTVAMDAVMADVTDVDGVNLDEEFVLLGSQGEETITANDLARLRNTIPWEVVTSMSLRLPRVYHADSVLMGIRTMAGDFSCDGRGMSGQGMDEIRFDDPVEDVAREIQLYGMTGPAMMFLEGCRPYRSLGSQAMLFFDPVLRTIFGSGSDSMNRVLSDESGIERLIERLEEIDEEVGCDA